MSKKKGKSVHKEKRHQLANRSPEEIRAEKVFQEKQTDCQR